MKKIRIGTRGSKLALWQANHIKNLLEDHNKDISFELVIIKTSGDKILDTALSKIGDKGLFTKELENALLNNEIDLAVHSMKDVPTNLDERLYISTITKREVSNDIFISNKYKTIEEMPEKSTIGTSSLRRKAQLANFRKDIDFIDIRGNVDTRLQKLDNNEYDAIILAYAGVYRLGLNNRITQKIPFEISLPAVGQGAIGIEIRVNDDFTQNAIHKINDLETFFCVSIERVFMNKLEGGCQIPIACQTFFDKNNLIIKALVSDINGNKVIKEELAKNLTLTEVLAMDKEKLEILIKEIGNEISDKIIKSGGLEIIKGLRN